MKRFIFTLSAILLFLFQGLPADYFWVGGTGNWSDYANHWATTSGGATFHTQAPAQNDNVYFDANSFTGAGQIVTIDVAAECADMDWTGASNTPELAGSQNFSIFGSLTFIPDMIFSNTGDVYFEAISTGETITSAGQQFNDRVYFNGIGGWILQDAFNAPVDQVIFDNGALDLNGQSFTAERFNSTSTNVRTLILGSSTITLIENGIYAMYINGDNFTLQSGTSLIKFISANGGMFCYGSGNLAFYNVLCESGSGSSTLRNNNGSFNTIVFNSAGLLDDGNTVDSVIFLENGAIYDNNNINYAEFNGNADISGYGTYGEVYIDGHGEILGDNTFSELHFSPGKTYTLTSGKTQTITGLLQANGSCSQPITIQSNTNGSQTTINKVTGSVIIDYCILKDNYATGGATFVANNTIDLGNNSGWAISPPAPLDLYWVGGTGNWDDPSHWSLTSGGPGGACTPSPIDNVYFDGNSFTAAGQVVTAIGDGNNNINCKNMNWTGVTNNPEFTGSSSLNLRIYGSLTLQAGMSYNFAGPVYFEATSTGNTIFTAGLALNKAFMYFNGDGGGWTLLDGLNLGTERLYFYRGTLNTNNQPVTADRFYSETDHARTLLLGSSIIELTENGSSALRINGTSLTFNSGTSLIKFPTANGGMYCYGNGNLAFHNVLCEATTGNSYIYNNNGSFNTIVHKSGGRLYDGCTVDSVTVDGSYNIYDNNNNINVLHINGNVYIAGNNGQYGEVFIGGNGEITGDNTFGTLEFSPGNAYTLNSNKTQTITTELIANGTCILPITIQSNSPGNQTTISKAGGNIVIDYAILQDQNATGGASFTANNSIDMGNNTGWVINAPTPLDLYWVGGTGDWDDPVHWSFTSGGPGNACIPSSIDNVYFDASSFTAPGQTVTLIGDGNNDVNCNNMDWSSATNNPTLTGSGTYNLRIYGSLTLNPNMTYDFAGEIHFEATTTGHSVSSAGIALDNNHLYFRGVGGEWTLLDGLDVGNRRVYLNNGTLNTNDQPIFADRFYTDNSNIRTLIMGASVFTLAENGSSAFRCHGDNLTLDAGTSLIKLITANGGMNCTGGGNLAFNNVLCEATTGTSYIFNNNGSFNTIVHKSSGRLYDGCTVDSITVDGSYTIYDNNNNINVLEVDGDISINGTDGQYGEVYMGGNGNITGNNTFGTLEFTAGNAYTLTQGKTQTILNDLIANGAATELIAIQSDSPGNQSNFSKASGTVTVEYVTLQDNNATGGATFIANNSIDLGNVTGWIINSGGGTDYYWVGGTGNWDDPANWSASSGGAGGAGVPTILDNVFFDANSFSAPGQVVTLIGDALHNVNCLNMDWTGATNNPELAGAVTENLNIYGSLTFIPDMIYTFDGPLYFESTSSGETVTAAGLVLGQNDVFFNGDGGGWTLMDDLNVGDKRIYLNNGSLNTNSKNIFAGRFYSNNSSTRTLNLGSSVVTLTSGNDNDITINGTNLTLDAGTSLIKFTGVNGGMTCTGTGNLAFYDVICESPAGNSPIKNNNGSFNTIQYNSDGNLQDGNTVDSVIFAGNGIIYDNNNDINYLEFNGNGNINGDGNYGEVIFNEDGDIGGNNTFGTLVFSAGNTYTLQNSRTQTLVNDLIASGTCIEPITIQSNSAGNQATFSKSSGTVVVDHVNLQDNNATGGATFIANNSLDLGNNTGWTINPIVSQDLYWVGGTGNWDDVSHWAASSGGPGGYCLPTQIDNVIFDANSFTQTSQAVYINVADAECQDMDWTGVTNNPTFTSASNTYSLHLYGSLTLSSSMNFSYAGFVYFEGGAKGKATNTITSAGQNYNNDVYLNGPGGAWELLDEFNTGNNTLFLNYGTLITNGQTLNCRRFISNNNNTRTLTLGSSIFNITASNNASAWNVQGADFNLSAGTSEIRFTAAGGGMRSTGISSPVYNSVTFLSPSGTSSLNSDDEFISVDFNGNGNISGSGTFNTVVFGGNGEINDNNSFGMLTFNSNGLINGMNSIGTLTLSPGKTYEMGAGNTQTILNQMDFWGDNCNAITLKSTQAGTQATVAAASGIIEGNYIYIQDMNATGGATFNLYNSIDLGNNTGWNFLDPPGDYFDLTILLEGPYNGTDMNTDLNSFLPLTQPYNNPPWNYSSCENVPAIPSADIVDWVLVEIRDAPSASTAVATTMVARQAAFLMSDGSVLRTDAVNKIKFDITPVYDLYALIWHRNHLSIMSANPLVKVIDTYTYDFSSGEGQVYGGIQGHKELIAGVWGMTGGDGNADGQINNSDKIEVWAIQAGSSGYLAGDFNLDTQVNNSDKNDVWVPNAGSGSQVP